MNSQVSKESMNETGDKCVMDETMSEGCIINTTPTNCRGDVWRCVAVMMVVVVVD